MPEHKDRQESHRKAYRFLLQQANSNSSFSGDDLMRATGWSKGSLDTYMPKQLREGVKRQKNRQYRVLPDFKRFNEESFLSLMKQSRQIFAAYKRRKYSEVVTYELLLPLTRETQLRKALDDLFYEDTILQRLSEVNASELAEWIERNEGEPDALYTSRVTKLISDRFGGYSIGQVSGRYRASQLKSRRDAAEMLVSDHPYLVDETTASVRFIIPIKATKSEERTEDQLSFEQLKLSEVEVNSDVQKEISLVRFLFFNLFVEAIVRTVQGEDEIWLLEEANQNRSLYVWERA